MTTDNTNAQSSAACAKRATILVGDVLATLPELHSNHFDAVLSDPPYGLSFMGKAWDHSVPSAAVYEALLAVCKPGAFGLHFGGTRTFHRLAVNLEDAGFEIRDCLSWLYGSGFPKSHNISKALDKAAGAEPVDLGAHPSIGGKMAAHFLHHDGRPAPTEMHGARLTAPATPAAVQWDGYGTALKPAWEPCLLVMRPLDGTFANNVLAHGCGALNIDGSRIATDDGKPAWSYPNGPAGRTGSGTWTQDNSGFKPITEEYVGPAGRFPANLVLDEAAGAALDASKGPCGAASPVKGTEPSAVVSNHGGERKRTPGVFHGDKGGPSRFFYTAKVSPSERNAGLGEGFAEHPTYSEAATTPMRDEREQVLRKNNHPTLKPLALTTYLAGLLLPPPRADGKPRRILVPFSGSGSEMIGALLAGWDEVVGIEISPEYAEIAAARIAHHVPGCEVAVVAPTEEREAA